MVVGRWVVILLLAIVVPATIVRLFGLDRGFPLVPLVALYPYVVLGAALTAGAAVLVRFPAAAIVAGAALVVGLIVLAPRVLPGPFPETEPRGPRLALALLNLREGRADAAQVVSTVTDGSVDVFVAVEVTESSVDALAAAGLTRALPARGGAPGPGDLRWGHLEPSSP